MSFISKSAHFSLDHPSREVIPDKVFVLSFYLSSDLVFYQPVCFFSHIHGDLCFFPCHCVPILCVYFFFFWHHFVYFEKRQKNQNKYRVNAKYAIVPFYTDGYDFLLVLNGMKPVILKCFFRCSGSDILG